MQAVDLGDPTYRKCMFAALSALREPDPTGGACHYHAHTVEPAWAKDDEGNLRFYVSIGGHKFFSGIP